MRKTTEISIGFRSIGTKQEKPVITWEGSFINCLTVLVKLLFVKTLRTRMEIIIMPKGNKEKIEQLLMTDRKPISKTQQDLLGLDKLFAELEAMENIGGLVVDQDEEEPNQ